MRSWLGVDSPTRARGLEQALRVDRPAVRVVGEHVGEAQQRGLALVVGVVALDRAGQAARQAPAAQQHAADQRVVDAQRAALGPHALVGRGASPQHLRGIGRVGVREHELADVVQQRADQQAVDVAVADLAGDAVGRALHGDGVRAERLGRRRPAPARRSKKSTVAMREPSCSTPSGRERLDRLADADDARAAAGARCGWPAAGRR